MDASTFKRILTTFADTPAEIDLTRGDLLVQVREEVVSAKVRLIEGSVVVVEDETALSAERWIVHRVARIPLLAERLLALTQGDPHFVTPTGRLLDQLELAPDERDQFVENAAHRVSEVLSRQPAGTCSVLYLTSDAGEGKTTLINELARRQAAAYKNKTSSWLLIPILLGGRTFLRLDEVIVAALVNRLRFPLFYDSFVELVRMGVLVPALDGFEEMFVEGPAGDAVSSLGNLMHTLQSAGSVLIAARRAYFEYKSLETQARLFEGLADQAVSFARLALDKWSRDHFIQYAAKRGVEDPAGTYSAIAAQVGAGHPLLSRAVLVRRLIDFSLEGGDINSITAAVRASPANYFAEFIDGIISREATEKWIDRSSSEVSRSLLTVEEHHELLASIAYEMWVNERESLSGDLIALAAELFCDAAKKDAAVTRQVVERIKHHALLVSRDHRSFGFDHEEFFHFFLGNSIARVVTKQRDSDIKAALRRGSLPRFALDSASEALGRSTRDLIGAMCGKLTQIVRAESPASFIRENAGGLVMGMLGAAGVGGVALEAFTFPNESMAHRVIREVAFTRCYFQPTLLKSSGVRHCRFEECEFERIDLDSDDHDFRGVQFIRCNFRAVTPPGADYTIFDPELIGLTLSRLGAEVRSVDDQRIEAQAHVVEKDHDLVLVERVLRRFLRSTEVNENTIREHLGPEHNRFMNEVLPRLERAHIIVEVRYTGSGQQRRYRLGVPLRSIEHAQRVCGGAFDEFVEAARVEAVAR